MRLKHKVLAGVSAALLAVGMVATPAFADTSEDCVASCGGSSYTSSPAGGSVINGRISWTTNTSNDHVTVQVTLADSAPDGNGPAARVLFNDYGNGTTYAWYPHLTTGNNTSSGFSHTFYGSKTYMTKSSVTIQACNGLDANGAVQNCGSTHGPFHSY